MPNLNILKVYQPRNPRASGYYNCVESHFEELEQIWDDQYASRFGFWRDYVTKVIHRYLECGALHFGFARVRCEECRPGHHPGSSGPLPHKDYGALLQSLQPQSAAGLPQGHRGGDAKTRAGEKRLDRMSEMKHLRIS